MLNVNVLVMRVAVICCVVCDCLSCVLFHATGCFLFQAMVTGVIIVIVAIAVVMIVIVLSVITVGIPGVGLLLCDCLFFSFVGRWFHICHFRFLYFL